VRVSATRAEVRRKYVYVKQHDRVGRMADSLEYSDVAFPRARLSPDAAAERTIREFGRAIRELAAADVFPGDILSKNFGVTRAGRVVFYDYDEMTTLTEVTFRRIPAARDVADEMAAEPWYSVGPNDAFPEEWPPFMFASPRDRELFRALNADLLDADWWVERQAAIGRGEVAEELPYPEELRLGAR
jgi:isocitrate dehydrogenase kinase/phosphatase